MPPPAEGLYLYQYTKLPNGNFHLKAHPCGPSWWPLAPDSAACALVWPAFNGGWAAALAFFLLLLGAAAEAEGVGLAIAASARPGPAELYGD